jgi:hypothetical protein
LNGEGPSLAEQAKRLGGIEHDSIADGDAVMIIGGVHPPKR